MGSASSVALRIVLALTGVFVVYTGLDQALGGLRTLGWLGQTVFFEIADQEKFLVADSHERFISGVWTGIGLLIFLALTDLQKYRPVLNAIFAIVFLGGLARLSQLNLDVLLSPDILWALIVEVVGMPILALWLSAVVGRSGTGPADSAQD